MSRFEPGNFIIWHRTNPGGGFKAYAGTVRHTNDYGAIIERYEKDSRGEYRAYREFYPYDHLTRSQVVGREQAGGLCE